ncbi:MAG: hypothetical protein HY420_00085 [Candidatus Kerfeldbacteria bacterium]|nr:hypothetical protein [Candidatus Kerfeldbacteria bacterium]
MVAFLFGAAVVVLIFGYMLWPKDEEITSTGPVIVKNTNAAVSGNANGNLNLNQNSNTNANANNNTNANSNTNTATDLTAGWKTYTNTTFGYSIKYPSDWKANESTGTLKADNVGFQSPTTVGDSDWGIFVFDRQKKTIEQVIASIGSQFSDRKESRKTVTFNGITATEVTVTTKQYNNWDSLSLVFEKNRKVYHITNGAVANTKFTDFYSTFTFTQH